MAEILAKLQHAKDCLIFALENDLEDETIIGLVQDICHYQHELKRRGYAIL